MHITLLPLNKQGLKGMRRSVNPLHDNLIKWKHFSRDWPWARGIHRSPVNSPHKGQWRRALMFSLICVWINGWVNNREAGDLRRYLTHYVVIVMAFITLVRILRAITSKEDYYCLNIVWTSGGYPGICSMYAYIVEWRDVATTHDVMSE